MKKIFLTLLFLFSSSALFAQEETLFGTDSITFGGYGAVSVRFTPVKGETGVLVGGYGGILLNSQLMIGGGGFGLVNDIKASPAANAFYNPSHDLFLEFGYGGGIIEYTIIPHKLMHATFGVLVGGGAATYRYNMWNDNWSWMDATSSSTTKTDVFFVVEPSVNIELNMISWMRMDLGGSYRFVTGVGSLVDLQNSDLRGGSVNLTFKFGKF